MVFLPINPQKCFGSYMKSLARLVINHSKSVLFGFIALILVGGVLGFQAFGALKGGGYDNPNGDSTKVTELLSSEFNIDQAEVVAILDFPRSADDPLSQTVGTAFTDALQKNQDVTAVDSYYSLGNPASLKSEDGTAVYFFVDLKDSAAHSKVVEELVTEFGSGFNDASVYFAGMAAVTTELNSVIKSDVTLAETIAVPIMIVLMLFVFGSLVAAGLPLLVGGLAIMGSFFFVWLSTLFTDTSVFGINLITGMGLGLGVDYALLMVNRFREERQQEHSVADSVERTMLSAGRTVLFSGFTVAVVLGALFIFPQYFLRSMGYAGLVVVILALAASLLALPAALNLLGDRVNKVVVYKGSVKHSDDGVWADIARSVMAKPVRVVLVALVGLGSLMALGSGVQFGQVDDRVLPSDNRVVQATNVIRDRFEGREASPVEIIVRGATAEKVQNYAEKLSLETNIEQVRTGEGVFADGELLYPHIAADPTDYTAGDYTRIIAIHNVEPRSTEGLELTDRIRALDDAGLDEILVGGSAAVYTDSQHGIEQNLPWALAWIVVATFILLFLFTGSFLLPLKAVLLNFLSLGATIGFLSWVFIGGHLKFLLGEFQVTGTIDTSSIVLIAVLTFGLSMDYELFLLSRIKEQHEAGLDTTESVALGLQKSGRIITAAALVLGVSFISFIVSGVSIMKMMGLGIAFAVLLDATIIRALLVPALMRLFGQANWWAPAWAKKIAERVGLSH
ncbi:MAG: MMPL family transporter [Microbacteriaceae bacterium]